MSPGVGSVVVTIPALDEAPSIAACVASVRASIAALGARVSASIVVAADGRSQDATAAVARRAVADAGIVVVDSFGTVGEARRRATEVGLGSTRRPLRQVWLATTDADTVVAPDWLSGQLDLAARSIVAVAGVVDLHEPPPALDHHFRRHYLVHEDGTHTHVHGANLGVRADAYAAAGGWRDLATGEDHDLWRRVREIGPVVHTTAVRVTTSARYDGRAPDGFAADLRRLETIA